MKFLFYKMVNEHLHEGERDSNPILLVIVETLLASCYCIIEHKLSECKDLLDNLTIPLCGAYSKVQLYFMNTMHWEN
jgi:hypothetical protein